MVSGNTYFRSLDAYHRPFDSTPAFQVQAIRYLLGRREEDGLYATHPPREALVARLRTLARGNEIEVQDVLWEALGERVAGAGPASKASRLEGLVSDSQNVHDGALNRGVKEIAKELVARFPLADRERGRFPKTAREKLQARAGWGAGVETTLGFIEKSLGRFGIDAGLTEILYGVFRWILAQREHREELLRRLNEELADAAGLCSTGCMARLVNVLQGFTDDPALTLSVGQDPRKEVTKELMEWLTDGDEAVRESVLEGTDAWKDAVLLRAESPAQILEWERAFGEDARPEWEAAVQSFLGA